jgi:hypothetical protein
MPPRAFTALRAVVGWPVASQQRSRRNAMIASTMLAESRRERVETEAFLLAEEGRREARLRRTGPQARVI